MYLVLEPDLVGEVDVGAEEVGAARLDSAAVAVSYPHPVIPDSASSEGVPWRIQRRWRRWTLIERRRALIRWALLPRRRRAPLVRLPNPFSAIRHCSLKHSCVGLLGIPLSPKFLRETDVDRGLSKRSALPTGKQSLGLNEQDCTRSFRIQKSWAESVDLGKVVL